LPAVRIGVLGTGMVGQTVATKLVELGHEVTMGARSAGNEKAAAWAAGAGESASEGSFADAAAHGELVMNCTAGGASLEALSAAGEEELRGKVLIDVANPLDFSHGMPPTLTVCNDDSLGEQIQRAFPDTRVVKALNTIAAPVMVDPIERTNLFICGDDDGAKGEVVQLLGGFGWPAESVIDLGGIEQARGTEMYLALWIRLMRAEGTPQFNIAVVR
jgi:8-hydroxy-5-deazaflavin:NADPH oxidoreductase